MSCSEVFSRYAGASSIHSLSRLMIRRLALRAVAATSLTLSAQLAHAGKTLDGVKQRGVLQCGVGTGVAGFSAPDNKGRWSGLDVDVCRAVAAAVLGDPEKIRFVPLNA